VWPSCYNPQCSKHQIIAWQHLQNGYRHKTYGSRYAGTLMRTFFVGRGTCVPAKIIARLGPGTLMAELRGPGTAFRCVPSYFNPWGYRMVKKLWRYVKPFSSDTGTLRTDRRTDLLYQYRASVCWRAIKINAIWWNIKINVQKLVDIMWIWIANELVKFHTKRLIRSDNNPKSFRGLLFWNTPYFCMCVCEAMAALVARSSDNSEASPSITRLLVRHWTVIAAAVLLHLYNGYCYRRS